jgi:hypothetical protein
MADADYGKLPLSFEANGGQTDRRVKFISRGSGYSLFLTSDGAVLALGSADSNVPQNLVRMTLAGAPACPPTPKCARAKFTPAST